MASLSSNTIVYKGMLIADQVEGMFPDLTDPTVESSPTCRKSEDRP